MKKPLLFFFLFFEVFFANGQNCLIPSTQRFAFILPIASAINADSLDNWFLMKPESGIDYAKLLISNIENGRLTAFDPMVYDNFFPNKIPFLKLSTMNFYNNLGARTDTVLVWNESQNKNEIKTVKTEADLSEIKSLLFIEDWEYDSTRFSFSKKLQAIDVIRSYYRIEDMDSGRPLEKPTFRIQFSNLKKPQNLKPYRSVQYEFTFKTDTLCIEHPQFTFYSWNILIYSLLSKVISGKEIPYDFISGKPISIADTKKRLGDRVDSIVYFDESGNQINKTVEYQFDPSEIKSVLFTENWQIDESTDFLYKTIREVTLIRHTTYFNAASNNYLVKKDPVFFVKLH